MAFHFPLQQRTVRRKRPTNDDSTTSTNAAPESNFLSLQRTLGNHYVQRLVAGTLQRKPKQSPEEKEKAEIVARIKKKYGISLDDEAGIVAVTKTYFKDQSLAKKNPLALNEQGWTLDQLHVLEDVLKKYEPILGAARAKSTLAGKTQGVTTFSRVDVGIEDVTYEGARMIDDMIAAGTPIEDIRKIAKMSDDDALDAGIDPDIRDMIDEALPHWKKRNKDVKAGKSKLSGYGEDDYAKKDPSTLGETFRSSKNISLYNSFVTHKEKVLGSVADTMRVTIAHEMAHALIEEHQLADFVTKFSDYWKDEDTRVTGKKKIAAKTVEAPITDYGATNAAEDLAESAGFYFMKPDVLTNGNTVENKKKRKGKPGNPAPLRKDYMDRVVAEWTSAPIKEFGLKSDAVLKLKDSVTMKALKKAYAAAKKACKALSKEERAKVQGQLDKMEAHYQSLLATKRAAAPAKP